MKIINWETADRRFILNRLKGDTQNKVSEEVSEIIAQVRQRGDQAILEYTEQWDRAKIKSLKVDFSSAEVDNKTKSAIQKAYENISAFHLLQKPQNITINQEGNLLSRQYRPIDQVGLYVPNGTAPLISTLLMLAIPAQIAGCPERVMVTPPNQDGSIHPAILYTAKLCGITQVYRCGGAQAIAALAYGTESIPKVMKVFGPGNQYVAEAKRQVANDPQGCAQDLPAGPSEVMVIADQSADPDFIAADLLAQAEHDINAKSILVTTSETLARKVQESVLIQKKGLSRQSILNQSIESIRLVVAKDLFTCFDICNAYAPEHLILQIDEPDNYLNAIRNAASVFIGPWSTEALGDYASGTNHILPTYGYAKTESGLCVEDFMKSISFQTVSPDGLLSLASCVEHLAELEGLDGHRNAVSLRRLVLERGESCQVSLP